MQLSKSEHKHRTKFIQECHYNKYEQRILDEAKVTLNLSYKQLYKAYRRGDCFMFMANILCTRLGKAMYSAGYSIAQK